MAYISISHQPEPVLVTAATGSEHDPLPLNELSDRLQLSRQTLVRWVDRHLIDASLEWSLSADNKEVRVIRLGSSTLEHLDAFASEYREDVVSCAQARRMLKIVDRKRIKKMLRAKDIEAVEVDGERRVRVGSIEDYLMGREVSDENRA